MSYTKAFLESHPGAPSTCSPQVPHLKVAEEIWLNPKGLLEACEGFQRGRTEISGTRYLAGIQNGTLQQDKSLSQPVPDSQEIPGW